MIFQAQQNIARPMENSEKPIERTPKPCHPGTPHPHRQVEERPTHRVQHSNCESMRKRQFVAAGTVWLYQYHMTISTHGMKCQTFLLRNAILDIRIIQTPEAMQLYTSTVHCTSWHCEVRRLVKKICQVGHDF